MIVNELNELLEKLEILSAKDYRFFLHRMYFTLELQKDKGIDHVICGKSKGYTSLDLQHYIPFFK